MLRFVSVLSLIICALCVLPAHADLAKWDFEDGTLQGWTLVSGDVGPQPVDKDDDRYGGNFGKHGKYFIGTYENTKDDAEVEYKSPIFTISADMITLLVGGGNSQGTCVALFLAADDREVYRETGSNSETMRQRFWDVAKYKGKQAYLKIVDHERGGWGHINVDDIHELTPQEQARIEAERAQREAYNKRWVEGIMAPDERKVYKGNELIDLAMPLGGIGAGNIAICGDGSLREWQIFNKVNSSCNVPGGFFAIWAKQGNKPPVSRLLQTADVEYLPTVESTEYIGEFPIAEVIYKDRALPVDVRLEAFSPFIPTNAKDSGIPGIAFTFRVKNPGVLPVSVSLAGSLQNAVNYDGASPVVGTRFKDYGGNVNTLGRHKSWTALNMSNPSLPTDAKQFGTMTLAALAPNATAMPQWDVLGIFWNDFSKDGTLAQSSVTGPSPSGRTWNGALAVPMELKGGEEKSVTFLISWNFPNFYADYVAHLAKYRIGRNYSNLFKDSASAAEYMAGNFSRLSKETHLFRDAFFDSTLPYWFVHRTGAPASVLTSQTMLWIEDGSFHGFEGSGRDGCCPMDCTHVYDYEMAMSFLFPELERKMRDTDLTVQLKPDGGVRHRTALPFTAPRETEPFVDGQLGTILKSYREYRMSADRKWFDERWPAIKRAMDFVVRDWDPNADGVLVNEQWNTYDAAMYGPNTFIGTMYLGALRAAEEMAKVARDADSAVRYRRLFDSGSERLDSVLFNGEYYIHIDKAADAAATKDSVWILEDWPKQENAGANRPYGTGCHADQLLGQWWADVLDLGYLLQRDRVGWTLDSIMKYNWRWDFADVPQQRVYALKGDKGLLNCTWPNGGRPAQMTLYSDEAWSGIEYEVAGLMLYEGKTKDACMIARAVYDRYNGVPNPPFKRNPWEEVECGTHYARSMSSWSMLTGAQGFSYCGPEGRIGFDPRIAPENHRSFFTVAEGWGTFGQKRFPNKQVDTIELKYGRLALRTISLVLSETPGKWTYSVKAGGTGSVASTCRLENGKLTITLNHPVYLGAGDTLTVEVKW